MSNPPLPPAELLAHVYAAWRRNVRGNGEQILATTALVQAQQVMRRRISESVPDGGLSWGHAEILMVLSRGHASTAAIGRELRRHPTNVKRSLDHLEEQGYVGRRRDRRDRRAMTATITQRGRAALQEVVERFAAVRFGLSGWDPQDVPRFERIAAAADIPPD